MSRSKHAVELCALLVDETYGELTSRIFTILLRRGRLPIQLLSQHTRLTARQLRHGLVVLVQQNLAFHYTDDATGVTYYEASDDAAYALLRSGKIMDIVGERYGARARDVVQNLLLVGHTKISDLEAAYEFSKKPHINGNSNGHPTMNGTESTANGDNKQHISSAGQLHAILYQLLDAGLVEPVVQRMFRSSSDTYNQIEKEELTTHFGGSTKGPKQKEELNRNISARLRDLRSEGPDWRPKGKKRPYNGDGPNGANGAAKRRRLSNGTVNGDFHYEDEGIRLDPELIIRINYEKFTVALRNQSLVELASNRIGETTSHIYAELLRLLEPCIPRCRSDPKVDGVGKGADDHTDGPSISTSELSVALSKTINVATGIGKAPSEKIDTRKLEAARGRKRGADEADVDGGASSDEDEDIDEDMNGHGNMEGIEHDSGSDGEDDPFAGDPKTKSKQAKVTFQENPEDRQNRMLQIRNHLMLLAGDDRHFVRKCGVGQQGEWTVDFDALADYLRETELDTLIMENFGRTGHRLARIMRKLGKLDEKQLPVLAMMKQKDVRTKLVEMQMAGFADIQEVPRDNNRATNRTIFLWYFDTARVSAIVLDNIYKAMSRCLQRLEVEKRNSQDIISLVERTDVRGNEEQLLSNEQMNRLREIQGKEDKLLAQVARLDELVGIFRDY